MPLLGIDISNWQSIEATDIAPDFVIVLATQGTGFVSPTCDAQYQRAKKQGKLLGFYHYASGGDPIAEADFFIQNCEGYFGEAIPILDWESYQNPRFNEHAAWCKKFLQRIYDKKGVWPMIYMSASVIGYDDWSWVAQRCALWIAGYPDTRDSWDVPDFPYSTGPWTGGAAIWQFTNSNGQLDRDAAYMTRDAWKRIANPGKTTTKPKEEKPVEKPVEKPKEEPKTEEPAKEPEPVNEDVPTQLPTAQKGMTPEQYSEYIKKLEKSVEVIDDAAKKIGIRIPMSNKVYDILKVVVSIVLPTISALYIALSQIWGFGFGQQVDDTIQLIIVTINAILGIAIVKSSSDYHKGDAGA